MSWWPDTSLSVSGRYFSTLRRKNVSYDQYTIADSEANKPREGIFSFNGQVSGTPLALGIGVVRRELHVIVRRNIDIHVIFSEVGHGEGNKKRELEGLRWSR